MPIRKRFLLAFTALAFSVTLVAQSVPGVTLERNATMKTRDGVTLVADIYRPADGQKHAVLLTRTPYNKDNMAPIGMKAAQRGFVVVIQNTRGRFNSDGEWYPFKHESVDGYDAVEWAAALPGSDGRVGMFSGSYVGATQMLAAITQPPHLAGICPVVTASNYHENWTYQGGAFEQWFSQSWTSGLARDTTARLVDESSNARLGEQTLPLTEFPVFNLGPGPIETGAALTKKLAPYYEDWLAHPTYDDYWKGWSIEENYQNIQVPALTIAAWYDIFLGGSLRNYIGLRDHAGNAEARAKQRLVVAIGGHSGWDRRVGTVDFGAEAPFDENEIIVEWYEYLFLGEQNQFADTSKPVRIFVMGKNQWRSEAAWPPPEAKPVHYYLRSTGKANTAAGDGFLSATAKPGAQDSFVYDPANPVPTVGGPLCCDSEHLPPGPRDQREVEARKDVLVYSTPPFEADLEVTGPVALDLFASTTAADTDFTAKLVDVAPDGTAVNLTDSILRARYRHSTAKADPIEPGKIFEYRIDLWSTSNVFLKGHRLRLEISSSNFPRFDRNLNTGRDAATSAEFVKATNVVYHDAKHPSALILSVVP
jgi:putative CocE/NonD family hydrolase